MTEQSYQGSSRRMTAYAEGIIKVTFDDFWSAGDKGRSSQAIPGMGRARNRCAIRSFCLAKSAGIPQHFVAEVAGGFIAQELQVPTHEPLSGKTHGEVLPGEWIWRRYLMGSLWQRVKNDELDPVALGFDAGYVPKEGELLPKLRLECTTKYEPVDRKLSDEEARDLMKLSTSEWEVAWELISKVAEVTDNHAQRCGFRFPDGKVELGRLHSDGTIILADTFGTPDENRIIRKSDEEIFSKDIIRNYLKTVGYSEKLKAAQAEHPKRPDLWPDYPLLPKEIVEQVTYRYRQFASAYLGLPIGS